MFGGGDFDLPQHAYYAGAARRGAQRGGYEHHFRAYSVAFMQSADNREELIYGGKIVMPASALGELSQLEIEYPMLFEITKNGTQDSIFAGVLEFVAEEGRCYLPSWMMQTLKLDEGSLIHLKNTSLPLGHFVKLQAQSTKFLEITDPRAVLERSLRNYSALTKESIIEIKYNNVVHSLKIMEIKPEASRGISVVETDLEVDFDTPVGYVDPIPPPMSYQPHSIGSEMNIDEHKVAQAEKFSAFKGSGQKLKGGDVSSSNSTNAARTTDATSAIPEALRLPPGKLYLGYPFVPLKKKDVDGPAGGDGGAESTAFTGAGQSLRTKKKGMGGGSGGSSGSDLTKGDGRL
ncbi:ubiquitin fusion degradation protein [Rhizophlyctis rosea]|uniref:Ubiquitin fusion degradation protein n=1 Tax=Rhizophlyctis rosea TaxID=64517 RepID=A0AAD5SCT6_9FUNG|nr:ubiquitin fusion degradation protein [Rhizophlyctis rosea]